MQQLLRVLSRLVPWGWSLLRRGTRSFAGRAARRAVRPPAETKKNPGCIFETALRAFTWNFFWNQ